MTDKEDFRTKKRSLMNALDSADKPAKKNMIVASKKKKMEVPVTPGGKDMFVLGADTGASKPTAHRWTGKDPDRAPMRLVREDSLDHISHAAQNATLPRALTPLTPGGGGLTTTQWSREARNINGVSGASTQRSLEQQLDERAFKPSKSSFTKFTWRILLPLLDSLDIRELVRLACVSKEWSDVLAFEDLWLRRYNQELGTNGSLRKIAAAREGCNWSAKQLLVWDIASLLTRTKPKSKFTVLNNVWNGVMRERKRDYLSLYPKPQTKTKVPKVNKPEP